MEIKIRPGKLSDLEEIQKLFSDTITFVCIKDYDKSQIEAWKLSSLQNKNRWYDLIEKQYFIVAEKNHQILGFASLENNNYIDVLFVHKNFQRQGIAQKLYDKLIFKAQNANSNIITSDVSKTAKGFFEANGFVLVNEQTHYIQNIEIKNFKMQKKLCF